MTNGVIHVGGGRGGGTYASAPPVPHTLYDVLDDAGRLALVPLADDYCRQADNGYTYVFTGGVWQQISPDTSQIHRVATFVDLATVPLPQRGDLGLVADQGNAAYVLEAMGPPLVWTGITAPLTGTAGAVWIYSANVTSGMDPGAGNMTMVSDGATPPVWTVEMSATDVGAVVHNLSVMKPGDTITLTDDPSVPPVTAYQRYSLISEPVVNVGWYTFTVTPEDVMIGTPPVVTDRVRVYGAFGGGGGVRVLGDLLDVETLVTPGHPAGPVGADVLRYDPDGGGAGVPLWVPGPDTHVVTDLDGVVLPIDEPLMPDGSPVPDGTVWLNKGEQPEPMLDVILVDPTGVGPDPIAVNQLWMDATAEIIPAPAL